jgi:hypothetical protein
LVNHKSANTVFGMQKISVSSSYQIGIIGSGMKPRRWCPAAAAAAAKSAGTMSEFPRTTHPESKPLGSATSSAGFLVALYQEEKNPINL